MAAQQLEACLAPVRGVEMLLPPQTNGHAFQEDSQSLLASSEETQAPRMVVAVTAAPYHGKPSVMETVAPCLARSHQQGWLWVPAPQ